MEADDFDLIIGIMPLRGNQFATTEMLSEVVSFRYCCQHRVNFIEREGVTVDQKQIASEVAVFWQDLRTETKKLVKSIRNSPSFDDLVRDYKTMEMLYFKGQRQVHTDP